MAQSVQGRKRARCPFHWQSYRIREQLHLLLTTQKYSSRQRCSAVLVRILMVIKNHQGRTASDF
ncbi:MAG: hypothetical protein F6K65_07305 [Moorea sp. SIO3C2]|nr:hypothetical protein [Moorena sp. SIO3C2]